MPLPVLVVPAAVAAAGGVAAVIAKLGRKNAKRVTLLGANGTGKTRFVELLAGDDGKPEVSAPDAERAEVFFRREVEGKTHNFRISDDLPGNDGPLFIEWKKAFSKSDTVLYMFAADRILAADSALEQRIESDFANLRKWRKKSNKPTIVLVGTGAERNELGQSRPDMFAAAVKESTTIKTGILMLKSPVVIGSLATPESAQGLFTGLDAYWA